MSAIAVSSGRMRWYLLTAAAALALGGSAHAEESWCPNAAPTCDWQEWYTGDGIVARAQDRAAEMSSEAEQVLEAVEKYPPGVPIREDFALSYSWTNFNETYLTDRIDGTNMKWSMKDLRSFAAGPYSSDTYRYALKSRISVINDSLRYYNRLWKQKGGQGDMPGYNQKVMDFLRHPKDGRKDRPASSSAMTASPCRQSI